MATLRIDEDDVRPRARGGEGRAPDADREPAVRPAAGDRQRARPSPTHPYKHPTIGSMDDLEAASVEDVREFYRTYYVPTNATLVVAGDFDSRAGDRPRSRSTSAGSRDRWPRCRATSRSSRRRTAPRRVTVEEDVAAAGRGRGASRHLRRAPGLVPAARRRRRCCPTARARASTASSSTSPGSRWRPLGVGNLVEHPNLFYAVAIVQPGHTPAEAEQALAAELDRLRTEPVTGARTGAREEPVHPRLRARPRDRPAEGQRRSRTPPCSTSGDVGIADAEFDRFQAGDGRRRPAGRADVLRAGSRAWSSPCRRSRLTGGGEVMRAAPGLAATAAAILAGGRRRRPRRSGTGRPSRCPKPLAAPPVTFPPYEVRTLPNGLRSRRGRAPRAAGRSACGCWSAPAPPRTRRRRLGVANMVASLLDQGTRDAIGAADRRRRRHHRRQLSASAPGTDVTFAYITVLKDSVSPGLDLLSDVVRRPAFAADELDRQREQLRSALRVSYQDPDYLASIVFDRLVYGFHPYGSPAAGTPASIERITRDDLVDFHQRYFAPGNCILAVVGDIDGGRGVRGRRARVRRVGPRRGAAAADDARAARAHAPRRDRRHARTRCRRRSGSAISASAATPTITPPPTWRSAFSAGTARNRLQQVLRTQRGLTYGASADLNASPADGRHRGGDRRRAPTRPVRRCAS